MSACVICHSTISESATALACGHVFHENCLNSWLAVNRVCPVCRRASGAQLKLFLQQPINDSSVCDCAGETQRLRSEMLQQQQEFAKHIEHAVLEQEKQRLAATKLKKECSRMAKQRDVEKAKAMELEDELQTGKCDWKNTVNELKKLNGDYQRLKKTLDSAGSSKDGAIRDLERIRKHMTDPNSQAAMYIDQLIVEKQRRIKANREIISLKAQLKAEISKSANGTVRANAMSARVNELENQLENHALSESGDADGSQSADAPEPKKPKSAKKRVSKQKQSPGGAKRETPRRACKVIRNAENVIELSDTETESDDDVQILAGFGFRGSSIAQKRSDSPVIPAHCKLANRKLYW